MRCLPLLVLAGFIAAVSPAAAQGPRGIPGETRSWVKLCEVASAGNAALFPLPRPPGVRSCSTFSEFWDPGSGMLLLAAGILDVEGRQTFGIKVPPGADLSGIRLAIVPRDLWQRVLRKELAAGQVAGLPRVRTLSLRFSVCATNGCTAETALTPQLLGDLRSGGGLVVLSERNRQSFAQQATLFGFVEAHAGPSVDPGRYYAARAELLRQLRAKQYSGAGSRPDMAPKGGRPSNQAGPKGGGPPGGDGYGYGYTPPGPDSGQGAPIAPPPVPPLPPPRPGSGAQDI